MSAAVLFVFGIGCVSHIPKRPRLRNGYGRSFFENRIFLASVFDERGIPRRPADLRRGHLEDTRRWRKQWWRRWRLGLLLFRHRGSGDRSSLVRPSILPLNSPHFHALGWPNLASEVDIRIQPQHNQSQSPTLPGVPSHAWALPCTMSAAVLFVFGIRCVSYIPKRRATTSCQGRIQPQHNQSQIPHLAGSAILRLGNITLERNSPSAAPNDIGIDGAERKASEFATGAVRRLAG